LDLQNHLTAPGYTIPIVFSTTHENGATKTQAMEARTVDFLQKPFSEEELLSAIEKGLKQNDT